MKRKQKSAFVPNPEQAALWPVISGNTINGVGEPEVRPPSRIMWHDSNTIPHGKVQDWFWAQGVKEPNLYALREERTRVIAQPDAPIAETRKTCSTAENSELVKQRALECGAELVGVVKPRPEWVFEGYTFDYPWMVVLGVAMDYEKLSTAPAVSSALTVVEAYTNGWRYGQPLSNWIRQRGFRAEPRGGPEAGPISLIPAALECGFGELGKHGSIINRQLGSNFRLAAVFTDMPLEADNADDFAAHDFCERCRICTDACPVDAITPDEQVVRGVEKWYVDFDKCFPYFAETNGCAICIAVCPWSAPDRAPLMAKKMTKWRQKVKSRSSASQPRK